MKLNGQRLSSPNIEILVLPRPTGDLVFKAQGIMSLAEFDNLCPVPQPPKIMKPGGEVSYNLEDPNYKIAVEQYAQHKTDWLVINSLKATEGLEWDKVKEGDSSTWKLWQDELRESCFSDPEITRLIALVMSANALNDKTLDLARQRFLASQVMPVVV